MHSECSSVRFSADIWCLELKVVPLLYSLLLGLLQLGVPSQHSQDALLLLLRQVAQVDHDCYRRPLAPHGCNWASRRCTSSMLFSNLFLKLPKAPSLTSRQQFTGTALSLFSQMILYDHARDVIVISIAGTFILSDMFWPSWGRFSQPCFRHRRSAAIWKNGEHKQRVRGKTCIDRTHLFRGQQQPVFTSRSQQQLSESEFLCLDTLPGWPTPFSQTSSFTQPVSIKHDA